jgi:hypothetical protein
VDPILDELRKVIARQIREGFDSEGAVIEFASEYASDQGRADLGSAIERVTAELFAKHRAEQLQWDGPTDCDKLDAAFTRLEERGIIARQHFTCCSTCGEAEIGAEIQEANRSHPVVGYVFYHMQDTECAAACGSLYLKYGSVTCDLPGAAEIGKAIAEELEAAGLKFEWVGDAKKAIQVVDLDWKRRR